VELICLLQKMRWVATPQSSMMILNPYVTLFII